ncbi:MAG: hypothetical protein ACOY71_11535 [Gemmatimonadota bacterium]
MTFAIDEELRPVLAAEARAAATAVSDHEVRIELLALADAATAGLVDADLADLLEGVLEAGLRSLRVRALHGAPIEAAWVRLFGRTPQGRAVAERVAEVNAALTALEDSRLTSVRFVPQGPGGYVATIDTDRGRLTLDLGRDGIALRDVSVDA